MKQEEFYINMVVSVTALLVVITLTANFYVSVQSSEAPYSDADEGSCICGLNTDILNRLDTLIRLGLEQSCTGLFASNLSQPGSSHDNSTLTNESGGDDAGSSPVQVPSKPLISTNIKPEDNSNIQHPDEIGGPDIAASIAKLAAELQKLQAQIQPKEKPPLDSDSSNSEVELRVPTNESNNTPEDSDNKTIDSGFLIGLPPTPENSHNEALMKLNQSTKVEPQEMADALQLTVPNIVSNIFSNIKNLTSQTAQQSNDGKLNDSGKLTSIDGSSVDVKGDSSEQIEAEGEKLFMAWIEHQLESLHLTVSTANYIRRNAVNLFRKIAQQYVERMEKIGGRVEDNVQKATQIALYNTEQLISFLLKNYVNFAGGMMKIIGERVSSMGKQLDSTGDTISHMSLNPLNMVSSVLDSLPNPSSYSQYFRAFGKQLMDDETGDSDDEQQESPQKSSSNDKQPGLIRKTMGALGKTLNTWIG